LRRDFGQGRGFANLGKWSAGASRVGASGGEEVMVMSHSANSWSMDRRFHTDTRTAKQIIEELLAQLADFRWTEEEVFGIHLAVEEALMNAIKHGNRHDSSKTVHVRTELDNQQLRIEITDQGEGFRPEDVPDPTLDENLELPSGRGLTLMRCYMTEVHYNELGNQVRMLKRRGESGFES